MKASAPQNGISGICLASERLKHANINGGTRAWHSLTNGVKECKVFATTGVTGPGGHSGRGYWTRSTNREPSTAHEQQLCLAHGTAAAGRELGAGGARRPPGAGGGRGSRPRGRQGGGRRRNLMRLAALMLPDNEEEQAEEREGGQAGGSERTRVAG